MPDYAEHPTLWLQGRDACEATIAEWLSTYPRPSLTRRLASELSIRRLTELLDTAPEAHRRALEPHCKPITIGIREANLHTVEWIAAHARKRLRLYPSIVGALDLSGDPQEREAAVRSALLRCAFEAWQQVTDEADLDTPVIDLLDPAVGRTLVLLNADRRDEPSSLTMPFRETLLSYRDARVDVAPSPEAEFMACEDARNAWRIITSRDLSRQQELIMWLVASGEEELAAEYGITPATFRQQKLRALKKLREPLLCPACRAKRRTATS